MLQLATRNFGAAANLRRAVHRAIRPQTLRTYLLASRFAEEFAIIYASKEGRKLARSLLDLPAILVEVLARWHVHDPEGAYNAVAEAALSPPLLKDLMRRELEARTKGGSSGTVVGRRLEQAYRQGALTRITDFTCAWPPGANVPPFMKPDDQTSGHPPDPTQKADATRWVADRRRQKTCAILVIGPYTAPDLFVRRAADWCLRSLGLSHFFDLVLAVLPVRGLEAPYISLLDQSSPRDGRLRLLVDPEGETLRFDEVIVPRSLPRPEAPTRRRSRRS